MKNSQPSRKKAVLIQVVGGYLNTAISITRGLLLLPLYFKYIDIDMYGYWVTIGSIVALISIVNFGIGTMVMQRVSSSYAKRDFQKLSDYFVNSLVIYIGITIVFIFISIVLSFWIDSILVVHGERFKLLLLAYYMSISIMVLSFFNNSFKGFSQALLKPLFGVYSTIIARLIGLAVVVYLLIDGYGLISIPISLLIVEILIFISNATFVYMQYNKLNVKPIIKKDILKKYLSMSPYLFGLIVGNTLSNTSHPIIITTFLGAEMTTAYTATRRAAEVILQMLNILNASLIGPFSHLVGEGNKEKIQKVVSKIVLFSFLSGLIMFSVYIGSNYIFVELWIGNSLVLDNEVIFVIGFSMLAYSMTRLFRSLLFGFNRFKFTSKMILLEGFLFVFLSIVLINLIGIMSIPLSLLIASIFVNIVLYKNVLEELSKKIEFYNIMKFMGLVVVSMCFLYIDIPDDLTKISWISFILQLVYTSLGIILIEGVFILQVLKKIINYRSKS